MSKLFSRHWCARGLGLVALISAGSFSPPARSAPAANDAYEKLLQEKLQSKAPSLIPVLIDAKKAQDNNETDKAISLYQQIREQAPWFSAAPRRLCFLAMEQKRPQDALALCREANRIEVDPYTQSTLAMAILAQTNHLATNDATEAKSLVDAAVRALPNDKSGQAIFCEVSLRLNDAQGLQSCSDSLKTNYPAEPIGYFFSSLLKAGTGNFDDAIAELDRALCPPFQPMQLLVHAARRNISLNQTCGLP